MRSGSGTIGRSWIGIAREALDHGAGCKLVRELKTISEEKYQHALKLANELRAEYLKPSRTARGKRPGELGRPVITVASAMAAQQLLPGEGARGEH